MFTGCFKFFVITTVIVSVFAFVPTQRKTRRIRIPFLGIGPKCHGCPMHFCDDDPAIISGYCCGCASFFDDLPVLCSSRIVCPANGHDLCEDYEYMMHCCCEE